MNSNTNRNNSIDIIKGMAIILMVYGHTFGMARDFIYLFHMPVFIFISGYCFNARHAKSLGAAQDYFWSRVKRLLLPYMGVNILFALLHNLFLRLNFYTYRLEFKETVTPIQEAAQTLMEHKSLGQLVTSVYEVITLKSIPQMGSATWFLVVLFDVCVIHCFVVYFVGKNKVLWESIFVVCLIIAYAISKGAVNTEDFAMRHLQLFEVYSCYLMGVFVREYSYKLPKHTAFVACSGVVAFIILYSIMTGFEPLEMSKCYIVHPVFLILVTALGMIMLWSFAKDLENNKMGAWFEYVGKHTMSILFLHILAFKLVSIIYCVSSNTPMYMVASWPVMFGVSEWIKIAYTIIGVAIPLLIDYFIIDRVMKEK